LEEAAGVMKKLPGQTVVSIRGYASNTGNPTANFRLSQRRVNAVRQVLVDAGVNPSILKPEAYGSSSHPTGNERIDEGRSGVTANGRPHVEFSVVHQ
jgi:outer membrane protein OmpA-like peptidoglycan-associated protein